MSLRNFSKFVALAALCLFISYGQTAANASLSIYNPEVYATPDDGYYTGTITVDSGTGEVLSETWNPEKLDTAYVTIEVVAEGLGKINFFIDAGEDLDGLNTSVSVGSYGKDLLGRPWYKKAPKETFSISTLPITHPCLPSGSSIGSVYHYSAYNWSASGSVTPVAVAWFPSSRISWKFLSIPRVFVGGSWNYRNGTPLTDSNKGTWSASVTQTTQNPPPNFGCTLGRGNNYCNAQGSCMRPTPPEGKNPDCGYRYCNCNL